MVSSNEHILVVEGPDDEHVTGHIMMRNNFPVIPEFHQANGFDKLVKRVRNDLGLPGLQALGILADADDSPDSRWQSIRDRLISRGIDLPPSVVRGGVIVSETDFTPRVGVWLMPDNQSPGELEHFVAEMIPDGDHVWPLSTDYVAGIRPEHRKFKENKVRRAEVHAWLAAREEPRQMGLAVRAGDLVVDGSLAQSFISWLRRLVGEVGS